MSTTAPTNEFLLKTAKEQFGFKPTTQVSLNYVGTPAPASAVFIRTTRVDDILPPIQSPYSSFYH